jgi:[ribosomal protein S5]-alanine N-acetyltransferase
MAFLRTSLTQEAGPLIRGRQLYLRPPVASDYADWAELRAQSRDHLRPFEPTWARDELTRPAFRRRIRHYQREQREDHGLSLFIFRRSDHVLMGGLTVSNIRRGVTQAATFGYWMGEPFVGNGYMTSAVGLAVGYAFEGLKLHRIEAACLPRNVASIRVLERNGFQREGLARKYLRIDGEWQDHYLFGLLVDDPRPEMEVG